MELTIPAALAGAAGKFGDGPALAEPGGPRISYHQLLRAEPPRSRGRFIAEGVAPGDRVAIWSPNTHHWVLARVRRAVRRRHAGPGQHPVHRARGARRDRPQRRVRADRCRPVPRYRPARRAAYRRECRCCRSGARRRRAESYTAAERLPVAGALPWATAARGPRADAGCHAACARRWRGAGVIGWADLLDRAAAVPASAAEKRAAAVQPGGRERHPVHLGHHRAEQGRDDRAPAVAGRGPGVGRVRRGSPARTATWWSTRSSTASAYKAGILACLVSGATLVPQLVYDAGRAMSLVESERITVLPGPPTIYQTILDHPGPGRAATCPACGSRSPARRPCRSRCRADAPRADLRDGAHRLRADRGGGGDDVPPGRRPADRGDHLGAGRGRLRGADRRAGRRRGQARRPRRDPAARAEPDARLPGRPGGDRGPPSTPTAGCTPATSAAWTTAGT